MAKNFTFRNEQIDGCWYVVCTSHKHFPMIKKCKDGTYMVKGVDGKPRVEKEYNDAVKFAKETFRRMVKFNKNFEE